MNLNSNFLRIKGFSLIELSIVLTIIATIIGSALSVAITKNDEAKRQQTIKKMVIIEQALAAFVAINDRLPCPGYLLSLNNSNAGQEKCNCTVAAFTMSGAPPTFSCTQAWANVGLVPATALKLPLEFMIDGWGNFIMYTVPKGLSGDGACAYGTPTAPQYFENCNMGGLIVEDATTAQRTNAAAYVLFSAGPNIYGGYQANSISRNPAPPPANTNETTNYNFASGGTFVQQEPSAVFDDIVRYKMKWQIVADAGTVLSNSNCTNAISVMTQDNNYYCSTTPGNINCSAYIATLANQINDWCLNK